MALPVKALPRATVKIDGTPVELRGLSRSEALHFTTAYNDEQNPDMNTEARVEAAELYLLQTSTGCTEDEARAFRDSNDAKTAGLVIDKIIELSGLDEDGDVPKGKLSKPS